MFPRLIVLLLAASLFVAVAARPSGGAGRPAIHVVKPYDTLWSIAAKHYAGDPREGVWEIRRRNDLRGMTIIPGQRLTLP